MGSIVAFILLEMMGMFCFYAIKQYNFIRGDRCFFTLMGCYCMVLGCFCIVTAK